jgi:hypothetical protein
VATETHRPVPHHEIVQALVETLGFRHIGVVHDEYAVSPDGMKAFGVLDLETEMAGCRFSIGLRNSHDKSMRLAMTCGYRVCTYAAVRLRDGPAQTTTLTVVCPFAITNGTHPAEGTRVGRTKKSAAFTLASVRFPGLTFAALTRV